MSSFLAIDFETADYGSDSACSIGLVRVEEGKIIHEEVRLIRPPRDHFMFTHIHGLTWSDVAAAPDWSGVWPEIAPLFEGVEFLAAHNSGFDSKVLGTCCAVHGIAKPVMPFVCTVQLARKTWNLKPANLPSVCLALGIELKHHEALSDARACAQIVMKAQAGVTLGAGAPVEQIAL